MRTAEHNAQIDKKMAEAVAEEMKKPGRAYEQRMFDHATSFHQAAIRCSRPEPNPDGTFNTPTAASIVNFAFAAELYLKAIIIAERGKYRGKKVEGRNAEGGIMEGHSFIDLAKQISTKSSGLIFQYYYRTLGRSPEQLRGDIALFSDAFIRWRYIFEKDAIIAIPAERLIAFTASLYLTIRNIFDLVEMGSQSDRRIMEQPDPYMSSVISLGNGTFIAWALESERDTGGIKGWQTMESAPKEEQPLLLALDRGKREDICHPPVVAFWSERCGGWAFWDLPEIMVPAQPTHWMHLPELPPV